VADSLGICSDLLGWWAAGIRFEFRRIWFCRRVWRQRGFGDSAGFWAVGVFGLHLAPHGDFALADLFGLSATGLRSAGVVSFGGSG